MRGAIPPLPHNFFMAWCLVKHRDNFTFLYIIIVVVVVFQGLGLLACYGSEFIFWNLW